MNVKESCTKTPHEERSNKKHGWRLSTVVKLNLVKIEKWRREGIDINKLLAHYYATKKTFWQNDIATALELCKQSPTNEHSLK